MTDPDTSALTRIIEYAKRESESQGREFTAYLLGLAGESLAERTTSRMGEPTETNATFRRSRESDLN